MPLLRRGYAVRSLILIDLGDTVLAFILIDLAGNFVDLGPVERALLGDASLRGGARQLGRGSGSNAPADKASPAIGSLSGVRDGVGGSVAVKEDRLQPPIAPDITVILEAGSSAQIQKP